MIFGMPYLKHKTPSALLFPANTGELNYAITMLVIEYLQREGLSYKTCNDIVGAMESAKMEFYRRVVSPYENQKAFENGDVYDSISVPSQPV